MEAVSRVAELRSDGVESRMFGIPNQTPSEKVSGEMYVV